MERLTTERVRLRPCRDGDIPALLIGLNDWNVAQWMPGPPYPYTETDARAFIQTSTLSIQPSAYAIADRVSDAFFGIVSLARNGAPAELGYWLLPEHHGKGLMKEAIACLLAGQDRSLSAAFATVDPGNAASIRVLEASGLCRVDEYMRDTPNRQGNIRVLRYELSLGEV